MERNTVISLFIGLIVIIIVLSSFDSAGFMSKQVAIIPLSGEISFSSQPFSDGINPLRVEKTVNAAEKNYDAIIFTINSGGGSVVASDYLAQTIRNAKIPTVCVFQEITASGALWAAVECDHLIANPLSMTGSIGVRASYLEFSGLLQKLGIRYVNVTAGRNKEIGSPFRNTTDEQLALLSGMLTTIHQEFIQRIATKRNISEEKVRSIADGSVLLGKNAKEIGLVDELGGMEEARAYLEKELGVNEIKTETLTPPTPSLLDRLFLMTGRGIASTLIEGNNQPKIQLN